LIVSLLGHGKEISPSQIVLAALPVPLDKITKEKFSIDPLVLNAK
jgi:hypothetical protein